VCYTNTIDLSFSGKRYALCGCLALVFTVLNTLCNLSDYAALMHQYYYNNNFTCNPKSTLSTSDAQQTGSKMLKQTTEERVVLI
jgi:hypothetical protein